VHPSRADTLDLNLSSNIVKDDYLDPNRPPFTVPGFYYDIFQRSFGKGNVGNMWDIYIYVGDVLSVLPLIAIFNTMVMSMVTASRTACRQVCNATPIKRDDISDCL
jgi:hypothetical protein